MYVNENSLIENRKIVRKYFTLWRRKNKMKKEKLASIHIKIQQREKLNNLMKVLKDRKKKTKQIEYEPTTKNVTNNSEQDNFKNRFNAQKYMIEKLQIQLDAKNRIIEDLKLGILQEDALKSLENSKIEIREIFANCSEKIKCKLPPPPQYNEQFVVSINKAPKILQEIEERSLKRARNREIILERKRIIDENRKRVAQLAIEKQCVQDEEERQKNLEVVKERQKKELERQKIRQANKAVFIEKWNKAINHHQYKILQLSFFKLLKNYRENQRKYLKAILYFNRKICIKTFIIFKIAVDEKYRVKYEMADRLRAKRLITWGFQTWREAKNEAIFNMQIAEDYCDFKLQRNTFNAWHDYVCIQFHDQDRKMKIAQKHFKMRLLLNYFYLWRSLPAVLQLERAKEQKKKKWREKVWEILPDYNPPQDDF